MAVSYRLLHLLYNNYVKLCTLCATVEEVYGRVTQKLYTNTAAISSRPIRQRRSMRNRLTCLHTQYYNQTLFYTFAGFPGVVSSFSYTWVLRLILFLLKIIEYSWGHDIHAKSMHKVREYDQWVELASRQVEKLIRRSIEWSFFFFCMKWTMLPSF